LSAFVPSTAETERLQAAADWHTRLEGASPDGDWDGFTAWLESDPRNRVAFDAVDGAASEAVELLSLNRELVVAATPARRMSSRAFLGMAGLAAAVLIAIAARPELFTSQEWETLSTPAGERLDVQLADGSSVHLNTNTEISVSLGGRSREVRLAKGEALFEVRSDADRPFNVTVGDRNVRVVGTTFNVLRHDGRITVTVEQGKVEVRAEGPRGNVRLGAGDQYAAREGAAAYQVAKIDPSTAAAWRSGRAVYTNAPLSEVASDLSRYYGRPIVVGDAETGALRFSGILKIEDQMTTLRRLEALLPVVVAENANEVRLQRGTSR
jgi:transmembrane sensor